MADPDSLGFQAESALAVLNSKPLLPPEEMEQITADGTERERVVRARVNQRFFRELVLAGYTERCAICGLPLRELLVASHIVPWSTDTANRLNPRNGLCLCGTHDRAFECGLIRVQPDYRIRVSIPKGFQADHATNAWLVHFEDRLIHSPQRWPPDPALLERKLTLLSSPPAHS